MFPSYDKNTRAPSRPPPPNSCDSQVHFYGDPAIWPPARESIYDPPDATMVEIRKLHGALGMDRGVLVQPTIYGCDNRLLVETLRDAGPQYRGIAVIDDTVSDKDLEDLNAAGVRGARFNFGNIFGTRPDPDEFRRSLKRIEPFGWHAKVHFFGDELLELVDLFREIKITVVVDHMGHMEASGGVEQEAFQVLLGLMRGRENWWVMISNGDRSSEQGHPWDDTVPFARALIEAAPDRTIWATDWPHVVYKKKMPNDGELVDLLYRYEPDEASLRKILVENPARLFGF
jgi:predicted TIM-barrel fold metal-dependent hydrolase